MSKNKLIKISVKRGNCSAFMEVSEEFLETKANVIANTLKKCLESVINDNTKPSLQVANSSPIVGEQPRSTPDRDEFKIRKRIPNNVVDVKELDIKQAVAENALVRCPNCAQAHCLAVNSTSKVYMMKRDYTKNDFGIIAEFDSLTSNDFYGMCCKEEFNVLDYFEDLQKLPVISDEDFIANNDTEIFCPICHTSEKFELWKQAFESPLEFFETEHLCDVCGGETVTKMIKKQKKNKCEVCGYETSYKEG